MSNKALHEIKTSKIWDQGLGSCRLENVILVQLAILHWKASRKCTREKLGTPRSMLLDRTTFWNWKRCGFGQFFTSVPTASFLLLKNITMTGTLRAKKA
jgi:hypothetical protein